MAALQFTNSSDTSFHINQNDLSGHVITDQVTCVTDQEDVIIRYAIIDGNHNSYISINSTTAVITMAVDGSDIQCSTPSCVYTPTIRCTSSSASEPQDLGSLAVVEITVSFSIENEFRPVFAHNQTLSILIREDINITMNPVIEQINATDRDLGVCGQLTYTIFSGNLGGTFQIDSQTGVITLMSGLDYETTRSYVLVVRVVNPLCQRQLPTDARLFVQVIDVDDELPIFTRHTYTFSILEGRQPMNFVQLECIDADTPSDYIKYREAFTDWPFRVDLDTGFVSATQVLDYEEQIYYELQFQCYDLRHLDKRDSAVVIIEVLPVNEHSPSLRRSSLSRTINNTIPTGTLIASNIPNTTAVFFIGATDQDRGGNHGKIEFKLSPQNDMEIMNEFFRLDSSTGNITLIKSLQYYTCRSTIESSSLSRLTVIVNVCSNHNGSCANLHITMFILHLANCGPTFDESTYRIQVNESVLSGTKLDNIVCNTLADSQSKVSKAITIVSPDPDVKIHFQVTNDTLVLREALDYEQRKNFTFRVKCFDSNGNKPVYAQVNVTVLPANDNPPRFDMPFLFLNFTLSASLDVPYTVGQVQAVDNDLDDGNEISYRVLPGSGIASDSDDALYLHIDNNGTLTLSQNPKCSKLVVFVEAIDGVFSDHVLVVVNIKNFQGVLNSSDSNTSNGVFIAIVIILLLFLSITIVTCVVVVCYYRQKQRKCVLKFQKSVLEYKDSFQLQRNRLPNNIVPGTHSK